jgi:large subunit ribosomal protein L32
MAVPKKRKSKSRRDMRRANHDRRTAPVLSPCPNCEELMLSHRVCPACGFYKGREVVKVDAEY